MERKLMTAEQYCVSKLMHLEATNASLNDVVMNQNEAINELTIKYNGLVSFLKKNKIVSTENRSDGRRVIAFEWKNIHEAYDETDFRNLMSWLGYTDEDFSEIKNEEESA